MEFGTWKQGAESCMLHRALISSALSGNASVLQRFCHRNKNADNGTGGKR